MSQLSELIKDVKKNPLLGQYIKESLLNKIPFVDRDKQETLTYLGARGQGLNEITGRTDVPKTLQTVYEEGNTDINDMINQVLRSSVKPTRTLELTKEYETPSQETMGVQQQAEQIPQGKANTPVKEIVVPQETIDLYVKNARKWASTTQPNADIYPYRQPDTVAENADYVEEYIRAIMELAPYYDLPPKTMASMIMQESGWGGQRFNGNLGGYGFLDSGEDLGIRFPSDTTRGQAEAYLSKVASDWNGRYKGSRSPQDFYEKGYNPHKEYPENVLSIMRMLEEE